MNQPIPDFKALRAERDAQLVDLTQRMAADGFVIACPAELDMCYCACSTGGPCEHTWDGPEYTSEDRLCSSSTCSRCGAIAMSHDLRVMP